MRRLLLFFSPGRLLLAFCVLVAAYLLVSAGGNLLQSFRLADDEARLRREVDELRSQEERLLQLRDALRSDDYVEYIARKVFGLVRPGEALVIVDAPPRPPEEQDDAGAAWWESLFGR